MAISVVPIQILALPNTYSALPDVFWTVTANTPVTLTGQLIVTDSLGTRPYLTSQGTLQLTFQRGDSVGFNTAPYAFPGMTPPTPPTITTVKTATFAAGNSSLFNISLTAQDATNITSGTVLVSLSETVNGQPLLTQWAWNYGIKKLNLAPGC